MSLRSTGKVLSLSSSKFEKRVNNSGPDVTLLPNFTGTFGRGKLSDRKKCEGTFLLSSCVLIRAGGSGGSGSNITFVIPGSTSCVSLSDVSAVLCNVSSGVLSKTIASGIGR